MICKHFSLYEGGTDEQARLKQKGIQFLRSAEGRDWYECQSHFSEQTIKVIFDEKNIICGADRDVSKLWPLDMSVAEVESLPEDFELNGQWEYHDGKVMAHRLSKTERTEQVAQKKNELLSEAAKCMAPLQDAVELGIATEEEIKALNAWKAYRVALHRLDPSAAEIQWPDRPE